MKINFLAILIFVNSSSFSQPFLGVAAMDKGACMQIGLLVKTTELTAAYKVPFIRADLPAIFTFSTGKLFFITKNDKDNYSITTSIGIAYYRTKDFINYYLGSEQIIQVSDIKPFYSVELGKDAYLGRVFISASYCKNSYFGVGIKAFPYRNQYQRN